MLLYAHVHVSSPQIPQVSCSILIPLIVPQYRVFCSSMERDEGKQSSQKNPYTELGEVSSDFLLAIGLQEQELERPTVTNLATIESESEEEEEDLSSDSSFINDDEIGDADFTLSQEFETDLRFLEDEESNIDDDEDEDYDEDEMDIEEDEVDPDELSYEELLELGEFIGEEARGLSRKEISTCLNPYTCKTSESKSGIDLCVICQIEYEEGETLVTLHCDHPYHKDCISKWLQIKKVCPICSNEASTPNKAKNT